jgi:HEAT repeat protein
MTFDAYRFATQMMWLGVMLVSLAATAVVIGRVRFAIGSFRRRRIERYYSPIIRRALDGDVAAQRRLAHSPRRHQFHVARLLATQFNPEDPDHIARARALFEAMALVAVVVRLLRSRFWWKRATALRALGALRIPDHTPAIVAALDDDNLDVRAAALDAIADLRDPASLDALVVRLHDESLHRGRRLAAIAAFGAACEPFLLEMADVDVRNRLGYARALLICGTGLSRPVLVRWTREPDAEVRAAAFEALAHVGLDADATSLALQALEHEEVKVRAMAAHALQHWNGSADVVASLARHLDDQWPVAVRAAKSLKSLGQPGLTALQAAASRSDLAGELARQTLWGIAA